MTKIVAPDVRMKSFAGFRQALRFGTILTVVCGLAACVVTPTQPSVAEPVGIVKPGMGMMAAIAMYDSRNYPSAIKKFDKISSSEDASANNRRLAHLGQAMVYLSNDAKWHSLENAKMSLVAAGQVVPEANEEFNIETDLLYDAITSVIGTESKFVVLQSKSGNSGAEVTQLKRERDELEAERNELLAEQKNLNEALEKLKQLTLGD